MLIHRIANQLLCAPELREPLNNLRDGEDASIGVAQSARPLLVAALWANDPRPCLVVAPGEEAADRAAEALAAWLGQGVVIRYRDRTDWPWSTTAANDSVVGSRCAAMEALATGEPCMVVASARALLRRVPPVGSGYYCGSTFAVGDEVEFEDVPRLLVGMGYADTGEVDAPGTFHVHGDSVDVFPAQAKTPVRIEFFGDEIDRIRRMVVSTKQTIADEESVRIVPCRELAFTDETVARARRGLHRAAQQDTAVAADLELIEQRANAPQLDRYLPELYGGKTASPLEHMSSKTLVVLLEPRTLLDDCSRAIDDVKHAAGVAHVPYEELYTPLKKFDFGKSQQRVSLSSIMRAGTTRPATTRGKRYGAAAAVAQPGDLYVQQPSISGRDSRMLGRVRQLVRDGDTVIFAVPDHGARKHLETHFLDEAIPYEESLGIAPQNAAGLLDKDALDSPGLARGVVTFVDAPIPGGVVVPSARLAVLSVADLSSRVAKKRRPKRVDPTTTTFPFKPGDYVVHARHGIALFTGIVRQEMSGKERDYFLLQYANDDKLYVPLERVDRITRYVGPDGSAPRLTRLNTADWSRATGKARRSAKKLAFDLVDLYTRRSSAKGFAFSPDTPAQQDMEANFSYDMTPDQASAVEDIKTDMESPKPMDRLLCGDVGFGKTEVALRAAFKCCMDNRQVMVLCPTTILAQQHYDTFFDRFSPFDLRVEVLSRFVTPARQRRALADFAKGDVQVLIGTHRLLSADVNPHALGLIIVDEEQRFGVQHKEQLKNLREQVDVLTLSATPIPRTMQMALSGVRDMSLILTPPTGRRPVKVRVSEYDSDVVSDAIRFELARGGQVYYVSNRVHTIDDAVERVQQAAPEARVAVAHGQMSPAQVEEVMLSFQMQEVDVLVATTIIESGIDNANTNTLIIEDSQRLGLAQLYQLKGRVGRGRQQAYAYFMFPAEVPLTPEATERLTALSELQDLGSGMRIAMRDLEIRGAGSLMGAEQHGNMSSVGFDLFTQMLGQAVAEARGEVPEGDEPSEVVINLPADFYLAEEYLADVDKRVMAYRRLAAANDLADVDALQKEVEAEFGGMPLAAHNIFDRTRVRIRCERLGIDNVALTGGRLVFTGVELPADVARAMRAERAIYFPKTHQLKVPMRGSSEELLPTTLSVLARIGGDDEE